MATKFQCDVLEYNYQIGDEALTLLLLLSCITLIVINYLFITPIYAYSERVYGCKYLSMIPNMHAEDTGDHRWIDGYIGAVN
jgi:hypothetical protein